MFCSIATILTYWNIPVYGDTEHLFQDVRIDRLQRKTGRFPQACLIGTTILIIQSYISELFIPYLVSGIPACHARDWRAAGRRHRVTSSCIRYRVSRISSLNLNLLIPHLGILRKKNSLLNLPGLSEPRMTSRHPPWCRESPCSKCGRSKHHRIFPSDQTPLSPTEPLPAGTGVRTHPSEL